MFQYVNEMRKIAMYIGSIIGKLGAQNRVEAVAIAIERGLLGPQDPCPAAALAVQRL